MVRRYVVAPAARTAAVIIVTVVTAVSAACASGSAREDGRSDPTTTPSIPTTMSTTTSVPTTMPLAAPSAALTAALEPLWRRTPNGCAVVTLGGPSVYEVNPEVSVVPASVTKLLTAAAALDVVGPDTRFTTAVRGVVDANSVVEGDLWIVGGGDPVLGTDAGGSDQPLPKTCLYQSCRIGHTRASGPARLDRTKRMATVVTVRSGAGSSGKPGRPLVLVVEDNAANQKVASLMLDQLGYEVDVVSDGSDAVNAITRTSYAAVLMDCQMPGMDGYEATEEIRRIQATGSRTPIIAMTAGAMMGDEERARDAGMDDFLTKPVSLTELGVVLSRWAPGARAGGAGRLAAPLPQPSEPAPGAGAASPTVLDPSLLAGLLEFESDGREGVLGGLVELFLDTARHRLGELRDAVATADLGAAARLAHSLKGSSASMAATGMAGTAERLERAAKAGDLAGAAEALSKLHVDLDQVDAALREAFPGAR